MTNEIIDDACRVAQALDWHPTSQPCQCLSCQAHRALIAAADEIERLTADRDHWEKMARTPADGDPLVAALEKIDTAHRIMARAISWLQIKEAAFATHKGPAIIEEMQRFCTDSPNEPNERLPNLVDRLKRINSLNDNPAHYVSEIDRLTACGKFIASDEYCERLIGHEGRCGLLPGTPPSVRKCLRDCGFNMRCQEPEGHAGPCYALRPTAFG